MDRLNRIEDRDSRIEIALLHLRELLERALDEMPDDEEVPAMRSMVLSAVLKTEEREITVSTDGKAQAPEKKKNTEKRAKEKPSEQDPWGAQVDLDELIGFVDEISPSAMTTRIGKALKASFPDSMTYLDLLSLVLRPTTKNISTKSVHLIARFLIGKKMLPDAYARYDNALAQLAAEREAGSKEDEGSDGYDGSWGF